jgi:hypothetical protein
MTGGAAGPAHAQSGNHATSSQGESVCRATVGGTRSFGGVSGVAE